MAAYDWVSLTTDYGLHGRFRRRLPRSDRPARPAVRVIDVTHDVPPGDVARAAAVLAQTVAVPAAGGARRRGGPGRRHGPSRRRGETPGGMLVGPDNGLLPCGGGGARRGPSGGGAHQSGLVRRTRLAHLPRPRHLRPGRRPAGRAAPQLADAGPALDPASLVRLPDPVVAIGDGWLEAEVSPWTGSATSSSPHPASAAGRAGPSPHGRAACRRSAAPRSPTRPPGELVVLVDSADRVAVAVNGGRAAVVLAVAPGGHRPHHGRLTFSPRSPSVQAPVTR